MKEANNIKPAAGDKWNGRTSIGLGAQSEMRLSVKNFFSRNFSVRSMSTLQSHPNITQEQARVTTMLHELMHALGHSHAIFGESNLALESYWNSSILLNCF
jgi:hypothetical protein